MTAVHKLRLLFEQRYAILAPDAPHNAQPLHAFLALPIKERLVLLLLLDYASEEEIRRVLPYATQSDARLVSKTMIAAVATLRKAIETPKLWIDPDNRQEEQRLQISYPSAAVCWLPSPSAA